MRPRVKVSEVKAGTRLKADYAFECIDPCQVVIVCEDKHGLFFRCSAGRHGMEGQESDDGLYYVGFKLDKLTN